MENDKWCTLGEVKDRLFSTAIESTWRYASASADFNACYDKVIQRERERERERHTHTHTHTHTHRNTHTHTHTHIHVYAYVHARHRDQCRLDRVL